MNEHCHRNEAERKEEEGGSRSSSILVTANCHHRKTNCGDLIHPPDRVGICVFLNCHIYVDYIFS